MLYPILNANMHINLMISTLTGDNMEEPMILGKSVHKINFMPITGITKKKKKSLLL